MMREGAVATMITASLMVALPCTAKTVALDKLPEAFQTLEELCAVSSHFLSLEGDNKTGIFTGTEVYTNTEFLVTPAQKLIPFNRGIKNTIDEKRQIKLPDGSTKTALITVTHIQSSWDPGTPGEKEANSAAECMQEIIDKLLPNFPSYFSSSNNLLFDNSETRLSEEKADEFTISFLSNTALDVSRPHWQSFHENVLRLNLKPPFFLNAFIDSIKGGVSIVPSYFDSPITVSAELIFKNGNVQPLSNSEQSLRAFPPTEWLWTVNPDISGDTSYFLKFSIKRQTKDALEIIPFVYEMKMHIAPDRWRQAGNFVTLHWPWIFVFFALSFGVFLSHQIWTKGAKMSAGINKSLETLISATKAREIGNKIFIDAKNNQHSPISISTGGGVTISGDNFSGAIGTIAPEKDDASEALKEIAGYVESIGDNKISANFNTVTKAIKDKSDPSVVSLLWKGFIEALPDAIKLGESVAKLTEFFVSKEGHTTSFT